MAKKGTDQDDNQPSEYLKRSEAPKKPESPPTDTFLSSMRSDILTSDIAPAKKTVLEKVNPKVLVGVLLALFFIALIWFLLAGPGRPMLENGLAALVDIQETPTIQVTASASSVTSIPVIPTNTPLPSSTLRPSSTPTARKVASPTRSEPSATATPSSTCRDALSITLADVGQTLCVKGTIIETVERPNAFMVIFTKQPSSFYWVSYDMVWSQAKLETCYQTTGKIEQIVNSPILIFNYDNLPEVCP